jgi:argininosuccinate lyase
MAENLGRDIRRLQRAFDNMNFARSAPARSRRPAFRSTGTASPNFWASRADRQFSYAQSLRLIILPKLLGATSSMLVNVGKFAQEFLLMATMEFNVIRLPDGFVQGSSIMPQKRNPVALEHIRAIGSKALGQSLGVMTACTTRRSATSTTSRTICSP